MQKSLNGDLDNRINVCLNFYEFYSCTVLSKKKLKRLCKFLMIQVFQSILDQKFEK
jgi:hypothetical protein